MKYRKLGQTDWQVSLISLGTVELGVDYGIRHPGLPNRPSEQEAIKLVLAALEQGINLLDTAPAYGQSEAIIGSALEQWSGQVYVTTKINRPVHKQTVSDVKEHIFTSIHNSLRSLRRDCLDMVQIHNAIADDFRDAILFEALLSAQKAGKIRFIGASVYDAEAALEAVQHSEIASLQVAYNLLDQRMAKVVFPAAAENQVGLLVRSALLKGVLTDRYHALPEDLQPLGAAAQRAEHWANSMQLPLAPAAIRFCLSNQFVSSVLVGVSSIEELNTAISVSSLPPMKPADLSATKDLALTDEHLIDPRTWKIP